MLEKTFTTLSVTPPPRMAAPRTNIAELNSRIFSLENQLGMAHRPPIFNWQKAAAHIVHLENLLTEKKAAAPAITLPLVAAVAAAIPVAPVVASAADADILKTTAAGFLKLESSAREHFCEQGGVMAATEFEKLAPKFKMSFIRAGGKIMDEFAPPRRASAIKDPPPVPMPKTYFAGNGATKTEAEFEALSASEKMTFIRNNGRVTED